VLLSIASVALANTKTDTIVYVKPVIVEEVKPETETERIERLITETFPERSKEALAIAMAESTLQPSAYNPEAHKDRQGNVICTGSVGVMQVACVHVKDKMTLHDVETNLATARRIYEDAEKRRGDGFLPWGAYTDGRYKQYLE
jgi:hypothetical protein